MVTHTRDEEIDLAMSEARRLVRVMKVLPGMRLQVPLIFPELDPFEAILSVDPEDAGEMVVRHATVELVDLDREETWHVTLPPPAVPLGFKRALASAEAAGSW